MVGGKWAPALLRQVTFSVALMTVGELKAVLCGYDTNTHVVAVWLRPHQAPEGSWLAEIKSVWQAASQINNRLARW